MYAITIWAITIYLCHTYIAQRDLSSAGTNRLARRQHTSCDNILVMAYQLWQARPVLLSGIVLVIAFQLWQHISFGILVMARTIRLARQQHIRYDNILVMAYQLWHISHGNICPSAGTNRLARRQHISNGILVMATYQLWHISYGRHHPSCSAAKFQL